MFHWNGQSPPQSSHSSLNLGISQRPIANGVLLRKLICSVVVNQLRSKINNALNPHQYGISRPNGTEIIAHTFDKIYNNNPSHWIISKILLTHSSVNMQFVNFAEKYLKCTISSILSTVIIVSYFWILTYIYPLSMVLNKVAL